MIKFTNYSNIFPGSRLSRLRSMTLLIFTFLSQCLHANTYVLPENGDYIIGEIQYVRTSKEDTLLDIARKFDLGFNEITAANPAVDPWLPGENTQVLVPTQFILPEPPWEGIIVNLAEMRLYYFPDTEAGEFREVITHPIGIGRQGWSTPEGDYSILMKIKNPSWTMPDSVYAELLAEGLNPPRVVPPGPDNPLGDYAMMISNTGLFIHGTNKPFGIGMRVSHGCMRLYPEDIESLVKLIPKGTKVRVVQQPYKFGRDKGRLFIEAHLPLNDDRPKEVTNLTPIIAGMVKVSNVPLTPSEWDYLLAMAETHSGIPIAVKTISAVSLPAPW